jgi:hypothetical protein
MKNHSRLLVTLLTFWLCACATRMQSVADFGGAASKLAQDYKPFVSDIFDSCAQRQRYVALGNAGPFDDAIARRDAASLCAPLKGEEDTATLFAQVLSDYANALAKLAGVKPTVFDSGIKGLSSAAGKLDGRDGSALFDSTRLSAAARLARAAASLAVQGRQRALARSELADNQAALTTVVEAMKVYASVIYAGQLTDTHDVMSGALRRLVTASDAPTQADVLERMPWRLAQTSLRNDLAANELESRRVKAFVRSADSLLAAHAALIANFDALGGQQRLAAVSDFVAQVQDLTGDSAGL